MKSNLHNLIKHIELSYNDVDKEKYIKASRKVLKDFAVEKLGLEKDEFEVSVNRAGHGSSADVSLKTKNVYITLVPDMDKGRVMYRKEKCFDKENRNIGNNNWISIEDAFSSKLDWFSSKIKDWLN